MQHNISEIFSVYSTKSKKVVLATRRYVETNGIFVVRFSREIGEHLIWARPLNYHVNSGKPLKALDLEGVKLVWLYGEKTWFDTEEELAAHRILESAKCAENRIRNLAKKGLADLIDGMPVEEVKAFMEKMGLW